MFPKSVFLKRHHAQEHTPSLIASRKAHQMFWGLDEMSAWVVLLAPGAAQRPRGQIAHRFLMYTLAYTVRQVLGCDSDSQQRWADRTKKKIIQVKHEESQCEEGFRPAAPCCVCTWLQVRVCVHELVHSVQFCRCPLLQRWVRRLSRRRLCQKQQRR
jgi:hypothetical protein